MEARAVYTIFAARIRDRRRAQVIQEIADGEARHRERIERRLRAGVIVGGATYALGLLIKVSGG